MGKSFMPVQRQQELNIPMQLTEPSLQFEESYRIVNENIDSLTEMSGYYFLEIYALSVILFTDLYL